MARKDKSGKSIKSQLPKFAEWNVKGDGAVYTTSTRIIRSQAGQNMIEAVKKISQKKSGRCII